MNFEDLFNLYEEKDIAKCHINDGVLVARIQHEIEDVDTTIEYDIDISNGVYYTIHIHKYNWNKVISYDIRYNTLVLADVKNMNCEINGHIIGAKSLCKMISGINDILSRPGVEYSSDIGYKKLVKVRSVYQSTIEFLMLIITLLIFIILLILRS